MPNVCTVVQDESPTNWNKKRSSDSPISVFYTIFLGIVVVGLVYLTVWGLHNNNIEALGSGVIFMMMLLTFAVIMALAKNNMIGCNIDIPIESTFQTSAFWFINGILLWTALAQFAIVYGPEGQQQNIFAFKPLDIAPADMPQFWKSFLSIISAPGVEESFFLITIPLIMFYILDKMNIDRTISLVTVGFTVAYTFAVMHVGYATVTVFLLAAAMFRLIQIFLYWGDARANIFNTFDVALAFALGAHLGNNVITTTGYAATIAIFMTNPLGVLCLMFFVVALYYWAKTMAEIIEKSAKHVGINFT
jgi:hypothetical protein